MVRSNRDILCSGGGIRRRIGNEAAATTDQFGKRLLVSQRVGGRGKRIGRTGRGRRGTRKRTGDVVQAKLAQLLAEVLVVAGGAAAHLAGGGGRLQPQSITVLSTSAENQLLNPKRVMVNCIWSRKRRARESSGNVKTK